MKKHFKGIDLEILQGDIAQQYDIDAVVNAANAQLKTGGGVAGALHRAAGPGLAEECAPFAPIKPGDAVITGAHNLPNSYVVHCLGPVYGSDKPEDKLLAGCYEKSLDLAEDNNISSIAFPAISAGAFGYPFESATKIALDTVIHKCMDLNSVKAIRFVLFSKNDADVYENILSAKL